jgi:dihydroorotase-like cyclic amidohydrolase
MPQLLRLPGLIDPHVHLRDPGATHKEDFLTGTRAALAGGFTLVFDMPNNPGAPVTTPEALQRKREVAQNKIVCDVGLYYGASPDNLSTYTRVAPHVVGLKLYLDHTTGDLKIDELDTIRDIMRAWPHDRPLCVHAEDRTVAAVLGLLPTVNRRVHFCHISEAIEIELIRDAKERGLPVTCEVAPHHLYLTEEDVPRLEGMGIMRPPLKRTTDRDSLWANLDIIDMIATDHAPHTLDEKRNTPIPFGVPGLETSLPLMLTAVHTGRMTIERLVDMMYSAPMRIYGTKQQPETYIEVDTAHKWTIQSANQLTKCGWTPFEGMDVTGSVRTVVLRGQSVVQDGEVIAAPGVGMIIAPYEGLE